MRLGVIGLGLGMVVAWVASVPGAAADSNIDGVEHIFGATNVHAVTGDGRMSVGVSADGDVTVLTWPNPSYCDQLTYGTSNDFHAREMPRFGAPEGAGMFLGLLVEHQDTTRQVVWLRDHSVFTIQQDYGPTDGPNPTTVYRSDALGLTATVVDAVDPRSTGATDVFVRDVRVSLDPTSTVQSLWLLTYANLAPTPPNSRVPKLPLADWAYDGRNDFAAVWDASTNTVVHFHPNDQRVFTSVLDLVTPPAVSFGPVGVVLQQGTVTAADVAAQVAALDTNYAPGAYLALTSLPAPDQHQIGFDTTPMCDLVDQVADNLLALAAQNPDISLPVPASVVDLLRCNRTALDYRSRDGWLYTAQDAYADAQDGDLSGSGIAAGEVNEALRTPIALADTGSGIRQGEASVVLGAGPTAAQAESAAASVTSGDDVVSAAETALTSWLADKRLPTQASADVIRVARRSLINVRVGTDAATGSIVASIARQPPYGLDWPRDGAFFDVMLDVSGQADVVDRREARVDAWQRKMPSAADPVLMEQAPPQPDGTPSTTFPAGGWEMNYYPDGMIGGVFRFEIDNAAFALWSLVAHVGWTSNPTSYLQQHWDAIELAADFLASWRDPATGLQAPAEEDDNGGFVQTLDGAVTTFGALDIASRAARFMGQDADAERWETRAGELRDAMLKLFWDQADGHFVGDPGVFDAMSHPTGPTAWLVWPMTLLPLDDPRIESQVRTDVAVIMPYVDLQTAGGSYFMKSTVSFNVATLGLSPSALADLQPTFDGILPKLAAQATEGTDHFGEVMLVLDDGGVPRADQRVATPHLWEGTLFYLTALAHEDPAALMKYDTVLPPSRVPPPQPAALATGPTGGGCDCHVGGGSDVAASLAVLALLALLLTALRTRSALRASRRRRPRPRKP